MMAMELLVQELNLESDSDSQRSGHQAYGKPTPHPTTLDPKKSYGKARAQGKEKQGP